MHPCIFKAGWISVSHPSTGKILKKSKDCQASRLCSFSFFLKPISLTRFKQYESLYDDDDDDDDIELLLLFLHSDMYLLLILIRGIVESPNITSHLVISYLLVLVTYQFQVRLIFLKWPIKDLPFKLILVRHTKVVFGSKIWWGKMKWKWKRKWI